MVPKEVVSQGDFTYIDGVLVILGGIFVIVAFVAPRGQGEEARAPQKVQGGESGLYFSYHR